MRIYREEKVNPLGGCLPIVDAEGRLEGLLSETDLLHALATLPDDDVRAALTTHRGIGRWTADIFLTMCLRRRDVWPRGDLALATAAHEIGAAAARPSDPDLAVIAERWAPDRAVAARMLWHHYLRERGLPVD